MKKAVLLTSVLICATALLSCRQSGDLVALDGSTSMERTIGFLSEAYSAAAPGVSVTYNPTGSSAGIEAVYEGRCDLGVCTRYLTEEEKSSGLCETVIAYDVIAVAVNSENPVNGLTLDELRKIFTGEIASWESFGGSGVIVPVGREAGSGTRDGFEGATDTRDKCKYRRELTSGGDIGTAVAENPLCIGYMSLTAIPRNKKVKAVAIDGVLPENDNIQGSGYKLYRPFILVSREGDLSLAASDFLSFAMSGEGGRYISMSGVSPAGEVR